MKDKNGLYYYPFPENRRIRMYVRRSEGHVQFRLWNQDHPMIWKKHLWTDWEAIQRAKDLYRKENPDKDPMLLYDLNVALRLLKDEGKD